MRELALLTIPDVMPLPIVIDTKQQPDMEELQIGLFSLRLFENEQSESVAER